MDDLLRNAALFGALALSSGLLGWWRRGGWAAALALAIAGIAAALSLGVLPLDAWRTWGSAWPVEPLLLLAGWLALGWGLRRAGGVGGWGPDGLVAFLGGAAYGGPPVALGLCAGRTPAEAARLALMACAGGLCGPLGSAPLLLLDQPGLVARLAPLGIAVALLVGWHRPRRPCDPAPAPPPRRGPRLLLWGAPVAWSLASWVSPGAGVVAALGLVGFALLVGRGGAPATRDPRRAAWLGATLVLVLLLVPAGALDLLTVGLDDLRIELRELLAPGAGVVGMAVAGLCGSVPVALAGALAFGSDPRVLGLDLRAALVAGLAVGGMLGPLSVAGPRVLRAGLVRWFAAAAGLLAWLALRAG